MGDPTVGWIAAIIIGGIAGWLAEQFIKSDMGLIMNSAWHRRGGGRQRHFELLRDRPRGMGRLPHCWLHWRVLADLGRPLDTGISPDSLRAAIGQARAQIKPRWRTLAGGRTRTGKPKIEGPPTEVDGPALSFDCRKSNLAGLPRRDQDEPSSPVNAGFKIKYSNFVNKPCWPEIRIRSGGRGSTGEPKNVFALRFGASCFDDLIDMRASSAARHGEVEDLLRLSPAYTSVTALGV
jgi:hypothetical protein